MTTQTKNRAIIALIAGISINLSVGVLYAWSALARQLTSQWEWTAPQAGLPFQLAVICFALAVFIGGRIQDKIGPKWVITCGGILSGLGLILSGVFGNNPTAVAICFGIISGLGFGTVYSCAAPPVLKWFHPSRRGMVSGLIVGGFGIGAVFFAPVIGMLFNNFNFPIETTMMILGLIPFLVCILIVQIIKNPPADYVPPTPKNFKETVAKVVSTVDFSLSEMMKTKRFYLMFTIFLFSSSVGVMIIGSILSIADVQFGITNEQLLMGLVAFLALTNTLGRVVGGMMFDRIGPINALFVVLVLQMLNMLGFMVYGSLAMLIVGIIIVGFSFGTFLAVFPALTAREFGLKNFGGNYGVVLMAWGLSAIVAPTMANILYETQGNFYTAYLICAIMTAVMIIMNYLLKRNLATLKQ